MRAWFERGLLSLGHGSGGEWAEWAIPGLVGILGVLQAFGTIKSVGWAGLVIVLLLLERLLARFRRGSALYQLLGKFSRINTSFAGNLDSVLADLLRTPATRLSEDSSKRLCIGLLHRVRKFAELALSTDEPLRATLAVPLEDRSGVVHALRVWCYDEPYHDRRWTMMAIDLGGAPATFRTGNVAIIEDVRRMEGIVDPDHRPYRSVVSVPVRAGGPNGRALAVVSLDAGAPSFFRERDVEKKLIPMIQPVVNALAMVLALRESGATYEFGS